MANFKIKKLACTFKPPSIAVQYVDDKGEIKYKQFQVVFAQFSNLDALTQTLITDYPDFFGESAISKGKLRKFLKIIIPKSPPIDLSIISAKDPKLYQMYKKQMDREFEMNQVKEGDPGFQYDLRVEVNPTEECDWDD